MSAPCCGPTAARPAGSGTIHCSAPCGCGCGKIVRGQYSIGHKQGIKTYREAGSKRVHVLRAERALGRPLPRGAHVHHADGTRSEQSQLVICQDAAYHKLLHVRMRIVRAGGNPDTDLICSECKTAKSRSEFYERKSKNLKGRPYTSSCRGCASRRYEEDAMNCCTEACGHCGRCTPASDRHDAPDRHPHPPTCDHCGTTFGSGGVSVAGLGTFCGYKCRVEAEHTRAAGRKAS